MTAQPDTTEPQAPISELTKIQRRVLGVLVEKAFTTPEYYPLTLKALTNGCNQKSNRHPLTHYDEPEVAEAVDELRQLGLVAVVHTETGRTERYRHYMRRRFSFSEPQIAILTELLLRGRQQLGELRSRAARMVSTESLNQLREELRGLREGNFVQTNGPLERRGVEIDHHFYPPSESRRLSTDSVTEESSESSDQRTTEETAEITNQSATRELNDRLANLMSSVDELRLENRSLRDELERVHSEFKLLRDCFEDLRRDLGG